VVSPPPHRTTLSRHRHRATILHNFFYELVKLVRLVEPKTPHPKLLSLPEPKFSDLLLRGRKLTPTIGFPATISSGKMNQKMYIV
jgi:hypothetical protein